VLSEALRFVAESGQLIITRLSAPTIHPIAPSILCGWAELPAGFAALRRWQSEPNKAGSFAYGGAFLTKHVVTPEPVFQLHAC